MNHENIVTLNESMPTTQLAVESNPQPSVPKVKLFTVPVIPSQEQQPRPQNLTAWPITIDGKEHVIIEECSRDSN